MSDFILASKSPRRRSLLRNLLDQFLVIDPNIEEMGFPDETPADHVWRIAKDKALRGGETIKQSDLSEPWFISADTIVVLEDEVIGKPKSAEDAARILRKLRGRTHQVLSGIALYRPGEKDPQVEVVRSDVEMREYTDNEIQSYIASGDPLDKAGAYAIQNEDFDPAPNFLDCFANVMGLPLCHLAVLLKDNGHKCNDLVAQRCQESIQYQCPVYQRILG